MKRWVAQYQTTTNGAWFHGEVGVSFGLPHIMYEAWWQDWYRTEDWWFERERYARWFRALGWWQRQAAKRPPAFNPGYKDLLRTVWGWRQRVVEPAVQRYRGVQ